jgi:hypothetical protein
VDYELAKSLMDAGFPQMGKGSSIGSPDKLVWRISDRVYVPTLEELIDACGENFGSLDKRYAGWLARANGSALLCKNPCRSHRPLMAHASRTIIATKTNLKPYAQVRAGG